MDDHLSTSLRAAIEKSGMSANGIAKRAGMYTSTVTRFINGEFDLSLSNAAKLATVLGLELRPPARKRVSK
jgi:ribosome-binding protein aMBF1 (putative translation factor)